MVDGTDRDKIKFAFQLHDLDNNGHIDRNELKVLIQQSFLENRLDYDEFQLDLLVDEFFERADKDLSGTIDFGEFLDVAHDYPDFMEGFAVNPLHWLIPDRYQEISSEFIEKKDSLFTSKIQVQDIGLFQWLMIPRLIFLYNVLMNRKKNRTHVGLQSIRLLPSKVLELTISSPDGFVFDPGDYLYINCREISSTEWYPFNIISKTEDGDLVLHVKSNNYWSDRLYDSTLAMVGKDNTLDWSIRVDGPYGSSSQDILDTEHAILIGAGHGISRIAPILQDIVIRQRDEKDTGRLKKVDLFWLIEDRTYFEWFTKMLKDMEEGGVPSLFNYHIYFLERSPEEISRRMMYISTDVMENETNISMVDNLWNRSRFGMPDWEKEIGLLDSDDQMLDRKVFYSGPSRFIRSLKRECDKIGINFNRGSF
jgi:ferredoxin-NADP reductase